LRDVDVVDAARDRHATVDHVHGHAVGHVAAAKFGDARPRARAAAFLVVGAGRRAFRPVSASWGPLS
jgi:hypothetical protein